MSEKKVTEQDLAKAIGALRDLAKGHSSRGTNTTEVESMRDAGASAGSDAGSTQVHHTSDNSDRGGWAGSTWSSVPEDGATDSVAENGTDYQAQGKMMKSIMDKLAKGLPLTAAEYSLLKGSVGSDVSKGKKKDEDPHAAALARKGDDDEEMDKAYGKDEEVEKSLSDFAAEDESVSKGLEVSEFLAGFAGVVEKSLQRMEERIVARLGQRLDRGTSTSGEFQKSLAEAVASLGEAVTAVSQRVSQVESEPAHAPRAVQGVHALEKGGFSGPGQNEPLSKALVAEALVDLVKGREASAQDVIRFESSGDLPPHLEAKVRAALGR